jgi:hypothetical protein
MRSGLLSLVSAGLTLAACSAAATPTPTTTAPSAAAATTQQVEAVATYTCGTRSLKWDGASAINLTGTWKVDDDGVYYLRQLDDHVWWLGMSGLNRPLVDRGSDWTNVYLGILKGDTVTGTYADVPQGQVMDQGPVILKLTPTTGGGIELVRTDPVLETGFGGSRFTPCTLG